MDNKHIKVLLIEDNPGDVRLIQEMVREAGAARFELAHLERLDEGLKRLGEEVFDVLLVDLSLPDSQGLDTFIRAQAQAPEVPIIVLTGLIDETLGVEAVRKGAQDYLVKGQVDGNLLARSMRYAIARKQAEENLREAAEEWRTTFDSITDLVSIHDRDFKIIRVNKALADTFKTHPKELIGKTCYEVLHGTKESPTDCPHMQTLETKKPATAEFFDPRLGVHREVSTSPIFNEKGEVIGSVHIAKDITKRKQAEEREKQLQQELNLSSRLASIGEMAAGIAHEINNPLTSVIGFSELLMERDTPEDIKQDLKIINENAQRVVTIIRNMLAFARPKGKGKEYMDINSIVSRVLEVRSYEMKTGNIAVTPQLAPDLPRTMADDGQIQQVLINIIINAEQAMIEAHGKGKLLVTTEKVSNMIRISITDDGPGIAEEQLDKIFDPFFSTKEPGEGTGLGLSVSYTIIKEHDGRLYVESQPGKGATFVVELPIVTTDDKETVK